MIYKRTAKNRLTYNFHMKKYPFFKKYHNHEYSFLKKGKKGKDITSKDKKWKLTIFYLNYF